jgi:hypothetical protein
MLRKFEFGQYQTKVESPIHGDTSTFMMIHILVTELSMVDMLSTYFLLTMIISVAKFTNVLELRLLPCLPRLSRKSDRIIAFC